MTRNVPTMNKYAYRISVTANHYWLRGFADVLKRLEVIDFEDYAVNGNWLSAYTDWMYGNPDEIVTLLQDIADFFRVEIECRIEDGDNDVTPVTLQPGESISSAKCAFWSSKLLKFNSELDKAWKQERGQRGNATSLQKRLEEAQELNAILVRDNKRLMRGE